MNEPLIERWKSARPARAFRRAAAVAAFALATLALLAEAGGAILRLSGVPLPF